MGSTFVEAPDEKTNPSIFPKALEKYDSKPVADELGLTASDRKALKNGWAVIKKKQRQAALTIYVNLFTEHEHFYDIFRYQNKLNIRYASMHQKSVLNVFQVIIEHLDNARFVKSLVKDIALRHRKVRVTGDQWRLYTYEVKKYFLQALSDSCSPTFVYALDKLMEFICESND